MRLLDQATDAVANDLAENLVDHRHVGLAADVVAELGLAHTRENEYGNQTQTGSLMGGSGATVPQGRIGADRDRIPGTRGTLAKHGMRETEASIANKISRGTFPATFLLASLKAIEREQVRLQNI
jgi:Domain of unknown function (DUF6471)